MKTLKERLTKQATELLEDNRKLYSNMVDAIYKDLETNFSILDLRLETCIHLHRFNESLTKSNLDFQQTIFNSFNND